MRRIRVLHDQPPCTVCGRVRFLMLRFGHPPNEYWSCLRPFHIKLAALRSSGVSV